MGAAARIKSVIVHSVMSVTALREGLTVKLGV